MLSFIWIIVLAGGEGAHIFVCVCVLARAVLVFRNKNMAACVE